MKKNVLIIIALFVCTAFVAQAQPKFGLRAGVNIAKPSLNTEVFKSDNLTGFQVGPTVDFTLPIIGLGFDASVLYSQQGMKIENLESMKQHTIDVPINLKYKFDLVVMGAYLTAGPYARFNVSDDFKEVWETKSFGAGLNFGAGVELLSKIQVGVTYQLGLTDDFSTTDLSIGGGVELAKEIKAKSRGWIISAAYFF